MNKTDPSVTVGPQPSRAEPSARHPVALTGLILLGAFWWFASGPSDAAATLLAGLGFAAIATTALLDAALGGPGAQR